MHWHRIIHDDILQHVEIQLNTEGAGAHGRHLPEEHVLRNTMAIVLRPHHGSFRQNFDRFLE